MRLPPRLGTAIRITAFVLVLVIAASAMFLFVGVSRPATDVTWGATFSDVYARGLGLDPHETYRAILDDLGVRHLRLIAQWDQIESQPGVFSFGELDWQLREAAARGVTVILAVGMKTPRWPECHIPPWAQSLGATDAQHKALLDFMTAVVDRYTNHPEIKIWQVENEPYMPFGECPPADTSLLKEEIALTHRLDPLRPVLISDTGEFSLWWKVASLGDMVGTTLYRIVYSDPLSGYLTYPLPALFYGRKELLVNWLFGKKVINIELQAEPWAHESVATISPAERDKTMSVAQFGSIIDYARRTGIKEFYLWGAEWWYFMKEKQNNAAFWDAAKQVFNSGT
jgi:hypothetical protein